MNSNHENGEVYPLVSIRCGDGKQLKPFHRIFCLALNCREKLLLSPGGRKLPPNAIVKFAAQKGWKLDKKGYALCPKHAFGKSSTSKLKPSQKRAAFLSIKMKQEAADMAKPKKLDTTPAPAPTIVIPEEPMIAEAPPAPTREDRWIIRQFLDANYDPDMPGWIKDWSDEKASNHLKKPRAWIAAIREDFYGPDQNEAASKYAAEVNELATLAASLQAKALELAEQAESLERRCRAKLKDKM